MSIQSGTRSLFFCYCQCGVIYCSYNWNLSSNLWSTHGYKMKTIFVLLSFLSQSSSFVTMIPCNFQKTYQLECTTNTYVSYVNVNSLSPSVEETSSQKPTLMLWLLHHYKGTKSFIMFNLYHCNQTSFPNAIELFNQLLSYAYTHKISKLLQSIFGSLNHSLTCVINQCKRIWTFWRHQLSSYIFQVKMSVVTYLLKMASFLASKSEVQVIVEQINKKEGNWMNFFSFLLYFS